MNSTPEMTYLEYTTLFANEAELKMLFHLFIDSCCSRDKHGSAIAYSNRVSEQSIVH